MKPPNIGLVLCAWAAAGVFLTTAGFQPMTLAAVALAGVSGLLRGRLHISRSALAAILAVCVAIALPLKGMSGFIGWNAYRMCLAGTFFLSPLLLRRYTPREELWAFWYTFILGFFSTLTLLVSAKELAIPVAAFMVALAIGMRFRIDGANMSWLALATLVPALLAAGAFAYFLRWSETKVNTLMSLLNPPLSASFNFANNSRLTSMLTAQRNPLVVLRYFSAGPPTHLVGKCYVTYQNSTWSGPPERAEIDGKQQGQMWEYTISPPPDHGQPVREIVELAGSGQALFMPRDVHILDVTSAKLRKAFGEVYESNLSDFTGSFELSRFPNQFLNPPLPADERARHLQLPADLNPIVAQLAREWSQAAKDDVGRAKMLESALQENFQYGFGYPFSPNDDPVAEFLTKKPPAHCELFASSLALMLRTLNIPTRYVNGFLVHERSPLGRYAIVRGEDAHAWVEAFIDGRWVHLDPTPPDAIPERNDWRDTLSGVYETIVYYWGRLTRMDFKQMLSAAASGLKAAAPILIGMFALYMLRKWRPVWIFRSAAVKEQRLTPELLPGWLIELEKELGGRPAAQTILEWSKEQEDSVRSFLEDYCQVRYGKREPSKQDLERLRASLDVLLASLRQNR